MKLLDQFKRHWTKSDENLSEQNINKAVDPRKTWYRISKKYHLKLD